MAEYTFNNNDNPNANAPETNDTANGAANETPKSEPNANDNPYAAYAARYGTPEQPNYPQSGRETPYQNNGYTNNFTNNYAQNSYCCNEPPKSEPAKREKPQKKKSAAGTIALIAVIGILASGLSGFGGVLAGKYLFANGTSEGGNSSVSPSAGYDKTNVVVVSADTTSTTYGSYAEVAAAVKDTVVEITTETVQTSAYYGQYVTSGAGSGVIISENGLILTNNHVIDGATKITVRLTDGSEYAGTLVGKDSESDVALVQIDATGLKHPTIGNSDLLAVGEEVLAIGNPLGELGGSVTNGIISALDREVTIDGETMNLLQTNAAVNPGNSGGGLFNLKGELVGVVNAKSSGTGIEGLGFAIPMNDALQIITELSTYGYVRGRVALNIEVLQINEITLQYYYAGYTKPGLYITKSEVNTELQVGDRIIAIDGNEISDMSDVKAALKSHKVGDVIEVTVVRRNKNVTVKATCYESVPDNVKGNIQFEN